MQTKCKLQTEFNSTSPVLRHNPSNISEDYEENISYTCKSLDVMSDIQKNL